MPEQVVQTNIQSHLARQWVQDCLSHWETVGDKEEEKREKEKQILRARYRFGRESAAAAQAAEEDGTIPESSADIKRELAQRRDRSKRWVNKHIAFYRACQEEYPGWDTPNGEPVDGYVRRCEENGYRLTWSTAYNWASDSADSEDKGDPETNLHGVRSDLEGLMERVEQKADEYAELYMDAKGELQPSEREQMEGVITRVSQIIDDTKRQLHRDLPEPNEQRVVFPPYTEWVIQSHACVCTGVEGEGIQPHHFRYGDWMSTGTATKPSDFDVLPLYWELHDELEDMNYKAFWEKHDTDPVVELHRLKNEWLEKTTRELRQEIEVPEKAYESV